MDLCTPGNIILCWKEGVARIVIVDFGMAIETENIDAESEKAQDVEHIKGYSRGLGDFFHHFIVSYRHTTVSTHH